MIRVLGITLFALALGACSWFDMDKDPNPPAPLPEFKPTLKVKRVWSASTGDDAESLRLGLTLATDGTNIFAAGADGRVSAFGALKGRRAWRTELKTGLSAGPAFGNGMVVVASTDGEVIALDAADGKLKWKSKISAEVLASPTVARDKVLLRAVDGSLRALDAGNGIPLWLVEQDVPRLSVRGTSSPVVNGPNVLACFDNGKFMVLGLDDGETLWEANLTQQSGRTELDRMTDLDGAFGVVGNDVYVSGVNGRTVALAVESGQVLWSREVPSYSGLGLDWNAVYVTDQQSHVVALERSRGTTMWRQEGLLRRSLTSPVPYGPTVVVGDFEGYVHWLSETTGEFLARAETGSAIYSAPLVVGEMVYVVNEDSSLNAYRAEFPKK
jgi:outer membrane protein assembly factor BamB